MIYDLLISLFVYLNTFEVGKEKYGRILIKIMLS